MTVLNAHYPITVDVVHKICAAVGPVDRIVIFQKFYVQAMVEFRDREAAVRAVQELHGCDIYSGCCTIKMEYAKAERLNVRQNDDKTWDFTPEFAAGGGGARQLQQQAHDAGLGRRYRYPKGSLGLICWIRTFFLFCFSSLSPFRSHQKEKVFIFCGV
jgi:hypothetical protein